MSMRRCVGPALVILTLLTLAPAAPAQQALAAGERVALLEREHARVLEAYRCMEAYYAAPPDPKVLAKIAASRTIYDQVYGRGRSDHLDAAEWRALTLRNVEAIASFPPTHDPAMVICAVELGFHFQDLSMQAGNPTQ